MSNGFNWVPRKQRGFHFSSLCLAFPKQLFYLISMPELSRFFGIIIRMYLEAGAPHHLPHFHAYYQDSVAVFSIDPVELIAGESLADNNVWLKRGRNCINRNL
jgi:hypothetical protein